METHDRLAYFSLKQILMEDNAVADKLAKAASRRDEADLPWEI